MISIKRFLSKNIRNVFVFILLVFVSLESGFLLTKAQKDRSEERRAILEMAIKSLKDPINQGSYIEAFNRTQSLIGKYGIECVLLYIGDQKLGLCDRQTQPTEVTISPVELFNLAPVKFQYWVNDTDIWKSQLFTFAAKVAYYLIGIGLALFFFQRRVRLILTDLDQVRIRLEQTESPLKVDFLFLELESLSDKIQNLSSRNSNMSRKLAIVETATRFSHDVRSPVSALKIIGEKLREENPKFSSLLLRASNQILGMAENLLRQNKIDSSLPIASAGDEVIQSTFCQSFSEGGFNKESIASIGNAMSNLVEMKRLELEGQDGLRIIFECPHNANGEIYINIFEFQSVLSNILNNAVEAMPNGGTIEILTEKIENSFCVTLKDQGIGFPTPILEAIHNMDQVTTKYSGNGIGLQGSIKYIRSVGGTLTISSNKTSLGSTLLITLPIIPS